MDARQRWKEGPRRRILRPRPVFMSVFQLLISSEGRGCSFLNPLWFVFNLRNPGSQLLDNDIVRNPYIAGSIALCTALLIAAVYLPGLSAILKTQDPGFRGWLIVLGMSSIPFILGQGLRISQTQRESR